MARASSPLSQRLKALAVRAGLPVDAGTPPSGPPAEDEQPTGEFPAVAASDTPDDDRPTGEFPAVAEVAPPQPTTAEPAAPDDAEAGSPDEATAEPALPAVPDPIWGQAPAAVPPPIRDEPLPVPPAPIWTDSPPESQAPQTTETDALDEAVVAEAASAPDGPTLSPPVLSKPAQLDEALALDDEPSAGDQALEAASTEGPATEAPSTDAVAVPEQAVEVAESPTTGEPADDTPTTTFLAAVPAPAAPSSEDGEASATGEAPDEPNAAPAAEDAIDRGANASDKAAQQRLSLTGRFAALRRRGNRHTAGDPEAEVPATPAAEPTAESALPAAEAQPAAPPPAPAAADLHSHGKPSFSERAALRRRVKTLRARRDTGLLELGAIVLDQRRFGDPTAGALLRRRTDELGDLDNEIAEIERALDEHASAAAVAALGAVRCVGCSALVGPTERYCSHCGTPRPVGGTDSAADSRS